MASFINGMPHFIYFREKCHLCEAMFPTQASLHSHLISSAHRRLTVICAWCTEKEKTFTRVHDLEVHVRATHTSVAATKDKFTRANGFYFAKYPEDYVRIVDRIEPYDSDPAYEARTAIRKWAEYFTDKKDRVNKWNTGWKAGVEIAGSKASKARSTSRDKSLGVDSRKVVDASQGSGSRSNRETGTHDKERGRSREVKNSERRDCRTDTSNNAESETEERDEDLERNTKRRETNTDKDRGTPTHRDRETDRHKDRETNADTDRGTTTHRDRETDRHKDRETNADTDRGTTTHRDRETDRHKDRETNAATDRGTTTHRDRDIDAHRDRERNTDRDRETNRQRDREVNADRDRVTHTGDDRRLVDSREGSSIENDLSGNRSGSKVNRDKNKGCGKVVEDIQGDSDGKGLGNESARKEKEKDSSCADTDRRTDQEVGNNKEREPTRKRDRSSADDRREAKQRRQEDNLDDGFENYNDNIELGEEAERPSTSRRLSPSPSPSASSSSSSGSSLMSNQGQNDGLRTRAEQILRKGYMPVCPPARRDWTTVKEFSLESMGITGDWPPENWKKMTPDQKLLSHEFVAIFLEKALGKGFPLLSRRALLEKYNFMALDGEGKPQEEADSGDKTDAKIRYYNFSYMKSVARGEFQDTRMTRTLVSSIEGASRWDDTDHITEKLDLAGVKLRL